nr:insulinase family protein [uncultured Anaerotignum sp.]
MAALEKCEQRCRIFYTEGQKFRTNLLVLFFDLPLKRETATKTALLAEVLRQGETPQTAAREAEALYGAIWDIAVVKKGERQLLLFSLETLKNVETEEALSFLRERLLAPIENGGFTEKTVERQKRRLCRRLEMQKDDKKTFARRRALEETAQGTAFALSADGYAEDLKGIDGKGLFTFYQRLLETARVKVFFCGERDEALLSLRRDFAGSVTEACASAFVPRGKPHFLREETEAAQARLLLSFSGDMETAGREATFLLVNQLLGGTPDSVLFQRLREQEGLCYQIHSYRYPLSPYLFVETGLQAKDAKRACREVLSCLEEWKKTGISKEKLEQAKKSLLREYAALADTPWGRIDFLAEQALQGREMSAERLMRQIAQADESDVLRAVRHLRLQAVYLLQGRERTEDAD